MDAALFSLLLPHLSVGAVFRLSRALGRDFRHGAWPTDVRRLVCRRIGMERRWADDARLREVLLSFERRALCRECGRRCQAQPPRYCRDCTLDDEGYAHMITRREILARYGATHVVEMHKLSVRKRSAMGAYLYLPHEVERDVYAHCRRRRRGPNPQQQPHGTVG